LIISLYRQKISRPEIILLANMVTTPIVTPTTKPIPIMTTAMKIISMPTTIMHMTPSVT